MKLRWLWIYTRISGRVSRKDTKWSSFITFFLCTQSYTIRMILFVVKSCYLKNIDRLTCYKSILNFIACIFHAHWSSKCQVEWLNTIFRDGSKNAKVFAIFDFQMNFSGLMAGFSFTFDPISRQEFDLSLQPIPRRCHHFVGAGDKCFILSSTRV